MTNKDELKLIMEHIIDKTLEMDLEWEWPCGVAYYGISRAYEVIGDETIIERLVEWVDNYIELGLPTWNVNTCAMGHVLITLYEATGDEKYLKLIESKIQYIRNDALRFGDNVLQHTVSAKNDFPEQAWADTLFMAGYFLLRYGIMVDDKEIIEDALNQYYWHIKYLQDDKDSLWYHGYNNVNKNHMSGFYWGRANAWAAYTMSQVIRTLPEWYLYPKCMDIQCALRDQLSALKKYQTDNGLWRTILNDESAYEEVSASAGITGALINNGNKLHKPLVEKAIQGLLDNISEEGRVLNVSGGTAVMRDSAGYKTITKDWIQGWGQGLALAALAAYYRTSDQ